MSGFQAQAARTLSLLAMTPDWRRIQALRADCDDATVAAIVEEAAAFAEGVLHPLDSTADRVGATVVDGRVRTPPGFIDAFRQFAEAGWLAMDVPEEFGGHGLPVSLQAACDPLFERGCVAMMMAPGSTRAAAHLLASVADPRTAAEWIAKFVTGEWSATICISEPEAGSDVGRVRTSGRHDGKVWRISGQKIWISFGDHDLTSRIGHCLLARTGDAPGTRGLSLFLVPDRLADGARNGVSLERIEEKMGLHASPTCALRFEDAEAILLGEEGRGLPQLFAMIELMRLQTGCQGLGIASAACDTAEAYALERRQGGHPDRPAVPIIGHADVRRQLWLMRGRTEIMRAAVLEIATAMDRAKLETDERLCADLRDFCGVMLPLIKNFGAETGFNTAHQAIQVLGGVGYTRDWPLEQHLRDARIMTIYEGTTGMQALDLLTRRLWRDGASGIVQLRARIAQELSDDTGSEAVLGLGLLARFETLCADMTVMQAETDRALWRADSYMRAAWALVSMWMAIRMKRHTADLQEKEVMAFLLPVLEAEFDMHAALCR